MVKQRPSALANFYFFAEFQEGVHIGDGRFECLLVAICVEVIGCKGTGKGTPCSMTILGLAPWVAYPTDLEIVAGGPPSHKDIDNLLTIFVKMPPLDTERFDI